MLKPKTLSPIKPWAFQVVILRVAILASLTLIAMLLCPFLASFCSTVCNQLAVSWKCPGPDQILLQKAVASAAPGGSFVIDSPLSSLYSCRWLVLKKVSWWYSRYLLILVAPVWILDFRGSTTYRFPFSSTPYARFIICKFIVSLHLLLHSAQIFPQLDNVSIYPSFPPPLFLTLLPAPRPDIP